MVESTLGSAHQPLRELVTEEIRRRILTGVLAPGERLVEDRLGGTLGVSRNPVREAIRVLATEGFVEVTPRRGAAVARPSPRQAEELFDVRMALEGLAAGRAAARRASDTARRLHGLLEAGRDAVRDRKIGEVADLNTEFHTAIAEESGNQYLATLIRPVLRRAQWVFLQTVRDRASHSWTEHQGICEAIVSGDEATAQARATAHVAAARHSYLASLPAD